MARGFIQVHGIDYEKTFRPIIRYDTLRIFLAIAAKNDSRVHQLNIVSAFLAEKLDEVIYLRVSHFLRDLLGDYVEILQSIYGVVNHSLCAVLRPRTPETRLVSKGGKTRLVLLKAVRLCRRL